MKKFFWISLLVFCVVVACSTQSSVERDSQALIESTNGLRSTAEFATIEDDAERSKAIFEEVSKVLLHPRCVNCHPTGDRPLQGDELALHQPLVTRGEDGFGAPGMRCSTCHGEENYRTMPGAPHWHLAPIEMAWEGKSPGYICEQIKDPERNGGMDLADIVDHMANDPLVAYGWNTPDHLEPAPGSQALVGQLTQAWVDAGAHCPPEESGR